MTVPYPPGGLYPAVGMHSEGEEVKLNLDAEWQYEELILMAVDSGEEEWSRLHDVKLNGMVCLLVFRNYIFQTQKYDDNVQRPFKFQKNEALYQF